MHPAKKQYYARIESFRTWPKQQKPDSLAGAGFFYFGVTDRVRCFFCSVQIKDWQPNDDPYQLHLRFSPKCKFIRQVIFLICQSDEKKRTKYFNEDQSLMEELKSMQESLKVTPTLLYYEFFLLFYSFGLFFLNFVPDAAGLGW